MKRKWLQHFATCAAGLACAAVLMGTPDPNLPAPGGNGSIPEIENQEDGEGKGEQPKAEPQDNKEFEKDKKQ